jgi:hypothetical protein
MTSAQLNRTQAGGPLSLAAFRAWLTRAKPGERLQYHRGYLALDRVRGTTSLKEAERRKLAGLADHASALAGQGKLHLVQERHGSGDCSYWAVVRGPSGSVVARRRLPAAGAHDEFAIADIADLQAGGPHHSQLSMAARLLEREELAQ